MHRLPLPDDTEYLHSLIKAFIQNVDLYYRLGAAVRRLLGRELAKKSIDLFSIEWRCKSLPSTIEKLHRTSRKEISQVDDRAGVRLICRYSISIPPILETLKELFRVQQVEDTTKRGGPAAFGYSSFHCLAKWDPKYDGPVLIEDVPFYLRTYRGKLLESKAKEKLASDLQVMNQEAHDLVFEVQVRTILQHAWASISHQLVYKHGSTVPEAVQRRLARLAAILEETEEAFSQEVLKHQDISSSLDLYCNLDKVPITEDYLKQYSADILGLCLDEKEAQMAYSYAQRFGLKTVADFEEIMIAALEALEEAFSNIQVRHLRGLCYYLDILGYWAKGHKTVFESFPEMLNVINGYRVLVDEELLQDVARRV